MMLAHLAGLTLQREMRAHHSAGTLNTGDIIIRWEGAAAPADPNLEASYPTPDPQQTTVKAFLHWVSARAAASQWTRFAEGDCFVTFDAAGDNALDLDGKRNVSFELPDGNTYAQAKTDRDPVEFWTVFIGGQHLTKTLLLRRK